MSYRQAIADVIGLTAKLRPSRRPSRLPLSFRPKTLPDLALRGQLGEVRAAMEAVLAALPRTPRSRGSWT